MPTEILPPFLFLFCCAAMIICSILIPQWVYLPRPWNNLGFIFLFGGLAIVRNIQRLFKQHQTEINTFKQPQKLVTSGLFRYSRNPIYLGFSIALFGVAIYWGISLLLMVFWPLSSRSTYGTSLLSKQRWKSNLVKTTSPTRKK